MSRFDAYRERFSNARLTRSKTGVLEVGFTQMEERWSSTGIRTNSS
jgi:hypothetical protein